MAKRLKVIRERTSGNTVRKHRKGNWVNGVVRERGGELSKDKRTDVKGGGGAWRCALRAGFGQQVNLTPSS